METRTALSIPTYDGRVHIETMLGVLNATRHAQKIMVQAIASSLLTKCFNQLWCQALNARKTHGITHFAMLHADISPEPKWLDKMHALMKDTKADMLSVVIALKAAGGMSSTAEETDDPIRPRNYYLQDCKSLTWTSPGLLLNTGMMLVDITKPWVEEMYFHIEDEIQFIDGKHTAVSFSEDWYFSRLARQKGAKLFATSEVKANHYGHAFFPNIFEGAK